MIDNNSLLSSDWRYVWLIVVTVMLILGVIFKWLSDRLHFQLEVLERQLGLLKPCPFCGGLPDVRNGCFLCKECRLTMYIPFRHYRSVKEMVECTWNRRWADGCTDHA